VHLRSPFENRCWKCLRERLQVERGGAAFQELEQRAVEVGRVRLRPSGSSCCVRHALEGPPPCDGTEMQCCDTTENCVVSTLGREPKFWSLSPQQSRGPWDVEKWKCNHFLVVFLQPASWFRAYATPRGLTPLIFFFFFFNTAFVLCCTPIAPHAQHNFELRPT
jgi:hypothetical protein